ncbi:class I SAM-dependent methyltransferase [Kribbella sp. NBC_01245]|uniref:class I SAM-dependent methyltransferase n=1 Tax=Kribbella sp. NBC_01245 TaxID=2903578 RepID=UPI002E2C58DC|nr:class I SAM-dependent methyltransferase [Kribbella sp. NBC_01245]
MREAEFNHPRLVEVYDAECPWSREDDFFVSAVSAAEESGGELAPGGRRVVDLGCGTGRLAIGLARLGHRVTGVDPAAASLRRARGKAGAERVTWIEGTSPVLGDSAYDVAVMTSHVAQFFVEEDEWRRTLSDLRRALVPGGRLAFDSRDPDARGWERWNPIDSRHRITMPDGSVVDAWTEVTSVDDGAVDFTHHCTFHDGEELLSTATLRFRSEQAIRSALDAAGFVVEDIYGGWNRESVGASDGELLVIAHTDR